jgi:hypothetical protein
VDRETGTDLDKILAKKLGLNSVSSKHSSEKIWHPKNIAPISLFQLTTLQNEIGLPFLKGKEQLS